VGSGDFALGPGTFRVGVEADDDAKYAVVVCGETDPSGSNRDSPDGQSDAQEQIPSPPDEPVPDVVGMNPEEACSTLGRSGYRGVFDGDPVDNPAEPGSVVGQDPQPGSKDFGGRLVHLLVSRSSSERPLEAPPGCVNRPG
jgi:beta-lactam-binding protein with PASTA domain